MTLLRALLTAVLLLAIAGCSQEQTPSPFNDAAAGLQDAGGSSIDAGAALDGGPPPTDAGPVDAGPDGGPPMDGGVEDGGPGDAGPDAGPRDGGPIDAAIDAARADLPDGAIADP